MAGIGNDLNVSQARFNFRRYTVPQLVAIRLRISIFYSRCISLGMVYRR